MTNAERRTPNAERRTPNAVRRNTSNYYIDSGIIFFIFFLLGEPSLKKRGKKWGKFPYGGRGGGIFFQAKLGIFPKVFHFFRRKILFWNLVFRTTENTKTVEKPLLKGNLAHNHPPPLPLWFSCLGLKISHTFLPSREILFPVNS